jgi:hypothetical protein
MALRKPPTLPTAPAGPNGSVYCPICTHTVAACVVATPRGPRAQAGQKCARCQSPLDAAVVVRLDRAA